MKYFEIYRSVMPLLLAVMLSNCASMATKTLYKSQNFDDSKELNQVIISRPTVIGLEENYESLVQRTYFPLLSNHFSQWDIDCIPYDFNVESDISDGFKELRERVPEYSQFLLVPQVASKKPDEAFADVMVEYRLFNINTGELMIYTQFDSTWGVPKDSGESREIWIYPSPDGPEFLRHEVQPSFDEIVFLRKAIVLGFKEIELQLGLKKESIHY